jgi:uncharacterized protein (TIGR03435 family)
MIPRAPILVLAAAAAAFGQSFEVASIKPSSPAGSHAPNDPLTLSIWGATLKLLIAQAYDVPIEQVSGGPAWTDSDRFEIVAKAASPATQSQKMEMLRALLADRFQLKFHRQPGTLRAYALVVAKGGIKFHAPKEGDPPPVAAPGALALRAGMKQLASIIAIYVTGNFPAPGEPPLSEPERLPVVDRTGLTGAYDIVIDLHRSRDWFAILEPQLGLKLEPQKVAMEMFIIDNAMRPSAN